MLRLVGPFYLVLPFVLPYAPMITALLPTGVPGSDSQDWQAFSIRLFSRRDNVDRKQTYHPQGCDEPRWDHLALRLDK